MAKIYDQEFKAKYNFRVIEKCCGMCKHFARVFEDRWCEHPELLNDLWEADEGCICDKWEKAW